MDTISGQFVERPNRFIVRCQVDSQPVEAFMANPGKMWDLMLPGAELRLEPTPSAKQPYRVVAVVGRGSEYIPLDTTRANRVAAGLLKQGRIPGLEEARVERSEVSLGKSRVDFLLSQGGRSRFLEVKSGTLEWEGMAMFPDARSDRAHRHLCELAETGEAIILFLIHRRGARAFVPDYHNDLLFAQAALELRHRVQFLAVAVDYDHNLEPRSVSPLEIPWSILEKEGHDRGCYWLWLHLDEPHQVEVGALGTIAFPAGYYLYSGSARRGLDARLARHLRLRKRHHWHIDYLRGVAHKARAIPIRTSDDLECQLAQESGRLGGRGIPGFGCSDCSCPSHLHHFATDPLMDRAFQESLLHLRMGRLL